MRGQARVAININVSTVEPDAIARTKCDPCGVITCGSKPIASAGGKFRRKSRKISMPDISVETTDIGPPPPSDTAARPAAALIVLTAISVHGRAAHGQVSGCTNISYPITINGGNRIKRIPVKAPRTYASRRNVMNGGSHWESVAA